MKHALSACLVILAAVPALSARAAADCQPAVNEAYKRGFTEGVAAVNAQLGAVTAQMQRDVQAQVNAQLAELDARRTRELEARLSEAQAAALAAQGPVTVAGEPASRTIPAPAMPSLPPLTRTPAGAIVPALPPGDAAATAIVRRPDPGMPADPAALPEGTTITITDPQNLPPDLFQALMAYAAR